MKDRFQQLATGKNAAHGALRQTAAPQGTAIDDLVNKDDLEDYFDNIAAAQHSRSRDNGKIRAGTTHGRNCGDDYQQRGLSCH